MSDGHPDLKAWEKEKAQNFFKIHPFFQHLMQMHLGREYAAAAERLEEVGKLAAGKADALAIESNRDENLPQLHGSQEIVFHPSYYELGRLTWGTEVLSLLRDPENETLSCAIAYLLSHNGEAGHMCPVACTAGAIKLLQRLGTEEQKIRYLPRLLDSDYSGRLHAAQFLTEIQGGSDVGANITRAEVVPERAEIFRISGEKWFCSVADAGLFVVTARTEGAPSGTRGLSLFLIPRIYEGRSNLFTIQKLKYKLGTRSMATGEIRFEEAYAEQIGPLPDGFKSVVGIVLDTSRVYNAIAACGVMARAYWEALTYARHRTAFGNRIIEFSLIRKSLSRMKVDWAASIANTFRILAYSKQDAADQLARRIDVSINKYWTSSRCTEMVRGAIEVLGGNGTIEDFSILPRLYRDAIVLESWEGTHNTLCMQVLRDFSQRKMHSSWLQEMRHILDAVKKSELTYHRTQAESFCGRISEWIDRILIASQPDASRWIRAVVDQMSLLSGYISLLQIADAAGETEIYNLLEYYRRLYIEPSSEPVFDIELTKIENALTS